MGWRKRLSNIQKHGIDFVAAKAVFDDAERIEITDDRHDYGEERIQTHFNLSTQATSVVNM